MCVRCGLYTPATEASSRDAGITIKPRSPWRGRRLIYRIANLNHALRTFFDTLAAIRKLRFT
jgi:hypothetical protein